MGDVVDIGKGMKGKLPNYGGLENHHWQVQPKPDANVKWRVRHHMTNNVSESAPVITLKSVYSPRAHWIMDDSCFMLLLPDPEIPRQYVSTPWIFKEAADALAEYMQSQQL